MLKELENTVLKLTKTSSPQDFRKPQESFTRTVASKDGKMTASQTFEVPESSSSSKVLKTTEDMKVLKKMVKSKIEESIQDIIEETADEMDMELDGLERSKAVEELTLTFYEIMNKLDNVEASMEKVQQELSKTDEMILNGEKKLDAVKEFLSREIEKGDAVKELLSHEIEKGGEKPGGDIKDEMSRTMENLEQMKNNLDKLSPKDQEEVAKILAQTEKVRIAQQNSDPKKFDIPVTPAEKEEAKKFKEEQEAIVKYITGGNKESIDKNESPPIKVATATVNADTANVRGLENTDSERRVVKHLESAIKEKLSQSGFDTGGRQIEVKVITATGLPFGKKSKMFGAKSLNGANGVSTLLGDALGFAAGDNEKDDDNIDSMDDLGSEEEEKQLQNMMYNLMIGNQEGFNEIDNQRKSENNYRFSFDDQLKRQEEILAKEEIDKAISVEGDQSLIEDLKLLDVASSDEIVPPKDKQEDDKVENESIIDFNEN